MIQKLRLTATLLLSALIPLAAEAQSISTIRDAEIEATIARMSEPIFNAAGLSGDAVEQFIVQDDSLNAFVVGRNMAFHTGLLMRLEDPTELLGVIAHETGHIAAGHGVRSVAASRSARGIGIATTILGVAAVAAGAGQAGAAIAAGGTTIAQRNFLKYSRGQESSADQAALSYLQTAGIDPTGMLVTLKRLRNQEFLSRTSRDPYVQSHPLSQERIDRLERRVAGSRYNGTKIDPEMKYWHGRMRAKLSGFLMPPGRTLRDVADDGSENALLARAVAYHRAPDPRRALQTMQRLLELRPNDPYYLELLGQIIFESGDSRSALGPVRRAVELAPDEPLIRIMLGQILLSFDDASTDRAALTELRKATLLERFDARAWRLLAKAESRAGNEAEAALAGAEFQVQRGRFKVGMSSALQMN